MKTIVLSFSLLLSTLGHMAAQTQIIAHRGFWECEGSAQNSITSLIKAQELNVFGSEIDVLVTSDGIPVVNHDAKINNFLIESTPYEKIKDITLSNGEVLPTLESYLIQVKKNKHVKLILEVKSHSTVTKEDCAVLIITGLVEKYQLESQVEYIAFSLNICQKIHQLSPDAQVIYLGGNLSPKNVKRAGLNGIDYRDVILKKNPQWIKEAQELGLTVNVWTVNDPDDMRFFIQEGIDYITTDKPILLKEILEKENK